MGRQYLPAALTIFVAFVFIQSLFFKFAGATETLLIFGTLDKWAADTFGIAGLFNPGGIFSANVVGSAELVASVLLLVGQFGGHYKPALRKLQVLGAALGLAIISGAIFFHLATPLGIVVGDEVVEGVNNTQVATDGGTLFFMAVGVWIANVVILTMRKDIVLSLVGKGPASG